MNREQRRERCVRDAARAAVWLMLTVATVAFGAPAAPSLASSKA